MAFTERSIGEYPVVTTQIPAEEQNHSAPKDHLTRTEIVSEVVLRELRKRDLRPIRKILRSNIVQAPINTEEREAQYGEMAYYWMKMSDSLEGENDRKYTVATIKNQVVGIFGFMSLGQKTADAVYGSESFIPVEPTAELVNFYVHPNYQQRGVGKRLWNDVHGQIAQAGCQSIAFMSTYRHEIMHPWYMKQGYAKVAEGKHFDNDGAYFYKEIDPQLPVKYTG